MKFVTTIKDSALFKQFEHIINEFNRHFRNPPVFASGVDTLNIGGHASGTVLKTVEFNVPAGGAIVEFNAGGTFVATVGSTSTYGLQFLWDSEAATNWNEFLQLNTYTSGYSQSFAHRRVKELTEGKHKIEIKGYRNASGTINAYLNYDLKLTLRNQEELRTR